MRRVLSIGFGVALASACLWWFFRGVDAAALWRRIVHADLWLVGLLVVSSVAHMALRARRWRTLLGAAGRSAPFRELFSAVCIGYMASILPLRVSEVLRPTALSRRLGLPLGTTLATVAAERVALDTPMMVVFTALFLVLPSRLTGLTAAADPQLLTALHRAGAVLLALSVVGLVAAAVLGRRAADVSRAIEKWTEKRPRRLAAKAARALGSLLPGLSAFGSLRQLARLAVETALIWGAIAAGIHFGVAACGVDLPPLATLVIIPVTALGIAVPTPGGAGTYHIAMKWVLVGLFGAAEDAAVGAGIVTHALPLIAVMLLGGFFVLRGGLDRAPAGPAQAAAESAP